MLTQCPPVILRNQRRRVDLTTAARRCLKASRCFVEKSRSLAWEALASSIQCRFLLPRVASLTSPDVGPEVKQIAIKIVDELLQIIELDLSGASSELCPNGVGCCVHVCLCGLTNTVYLSPRQALASGLVLPAADKPS